MLTLNRCTFGKYVRRHYTWQDKGYVFSGAVKAGQKIHPDGGRDRQPLNKSAKHLPAGGCFLL